MSAPDSIAEQLQSVSNIGRRLGVVEIQLAVNGWLMRHQAELSVAAMRELLQAVQLCNDPRADL